MESTSRVLLGSQSEEFGWFPSMSTSSIPIRVDTREVGHIHVLLPTPEYSEPMGSPTILGLTSPRALRSRVLQAPSASEDVHWVHSSASGFRYLVNECLGCFWIWLPVFRVHRMLRVVFRVLLRPHRDYEVLKPRIYLDMWCATYLRSIWSSPRALG